MLFANLKMNKNLDEMNDYLKFFNDNLSNEDTVFIPSFPFLSLESRGRLVFGAQNVSSYETGSYTGEVSAAQLKSMNIKYVLVGHSERRKYFEGETKRLSLKAKLALDNEIIPIICVGESKEQRELKKTTTIIKRQVLDALQGLDSVDKIIMAYEPVWSIGSGSIPTNDEIEEIISYIKKIVLNNYQTEVKVLYGGSVNPGNINTLKKISNVDGYLVGTACKDQKEFLKLSNMC